MKSFIKLFAILFIITFVIAQTTAFAQENETATAKEEVQISSQKDCSGGGCAEKPKCCGQKKHAEMKRLKQDSCESACRAEKTAEIQKKRLFKRSQSKHVCTDQCKRG